MFQKIKYKEIINKISIYIKNSRIPPCLSNKIELIIPNYLFGTICLSKKLSLLSFIQISDLQSQEQ